MGTVRVALSLSCSVTEVCGLRSGIHGRLSHATHQRVPQGQGGEMASLGDAELPLTLRVWFFLCSALFLAVLLRPLHLRAGAEVPEYSLHHGVFPGMCPEDHRLWLLGTSRSPRIPTLCQTEGGRPFPQRVHAPTHLTVGGLLSTAR